VELIADTSLLVGIWRRQPWAMDFARANQGRSLALPWVVLGEFWHGAIKAGHDRERVQAFLRIGLEINDAGPVIPHYARLCVQAQEEGFYAQVGQNDFWIAAVSIALDLPLVSRNRRHFDKFRDLRLKSLTD